MAFKDLKVDELRTVCEFFGVEPVAADPAKPTKPEMLAGLELDGVTWDQYKKNLDPEAGPEPEPEVLVADKVDPATGVLLFMDRANPTLMVRGYRFTQEHPFATVKAEDAMYIIRNYTGIRPALPEEAERYYK